jgi:formate dehydrogenase (coenzyme F420) beta subunit
MHCVVPLQNGDTLGGVRHLLRSVLQSGAVDALLVPLRHPAGAAISQALLKDPAMLELADPFAPVLPVNGARLASMLTQHTPRPRLGVVMRSCEIRALIELVKLQQASVEGMVIVGVDCPGTLEVADFARIARGADPSSLPLRSACQMCEYPSPPHYDILIQRFGVADENSLLHVDVKEDWAQRLGLAECAEPPARAQELAALIAERSATRDRSLAQLAAQITSPQQLADFFSTCIRCHNCMTNCPLCYCKTCFFKTDVFDHEPMQYLTWAERKGATRLPSDTLLFHLTRMNHMSTSCVGCGLCTSACPVDIPVGSAFRSAAARTQALFGYVPGRSLDEVPPVKAFQVDELRDLGEK